jgi:tetratricopeptide (TPR) repeat protein
VVRKDYQKAVTYLIPAIDINRRSFSGYYALGYAAYQMNRIPEAVEASKAAVVLNGKSLNALWLYGTVLRLNGNYDLAEKTLVQGKTLGKTAFPEIHWQLALLYNKLGRNAEAANELDSYLKAQPEGVNKKEIKELIAKLRVASK